MSRKVTYSIVALLILLIAGVVAMNVWQYRDLQRIRKEFLSPKPQQADGTSPIQTDKTDENEGHTHTDGTFHAEEHPPYTPTPVQIPDNITNPDVAAAWERLEYISKNRYQWGTFSPRALELMDQLTPVPSIYDHIEDKGCGGEFIPVLDKLAKLRDPRSAELLVSYQMDSGVSGGEPDNALVAMGPASIPALIGRLDDISEGTSLFTPLYLLPRIVEAHRSELGSIIQHIVIPKLEVIATYKGTEGRAEDNKQFALNALETILQKPKNR